MHIKCSGLKNCFISLVQLVFIQHWNCSIAFHFDCSNLLRFLSGCLGCRPIFSDSPGYYRRFVTNYWDLTSPLTLTDLTKYKAPDPVQWKELCQQAFAQEKAALCGGPQITLS